MENAEYFQEKIMSLRQKLHAMDGFEPIENISENIPEPTQIKSVIFSNKEKEDHEK